MQFDQFSAGWIIDQYQVLSAIHTRHNDEMEPGGSCGLSDTNDERTAFLQMSFEILPISNERENAVSVFPQKRCQVTGTNAFGLSGGQTFHDLRVGRHGGWTGGGVFMPVTHYHRDTGGPTPVLALLNERNIQPYGLETGRSPKSAEQEA
jgi:hypothetical protein